MAVRFAIVLMFLGPLAAAAGETAEMRAARFYAAGLALPLLQIRNGAMLMQACSKRLRRACDKQQRELATNISEASAAVLRAAGAYDRILFARYGATLRACPDDDVTVFRESLETLVRIDLTGFQSLADEELIEATGSIARDEESIAASLRQSAEACVAARKLGEYLMQLMDAKLQPWSGEKKRVENAQGNFQFGVPKVEPTASEKHRQDRELAHAVAGNFVTVVATELQLTVFPESESRIQAVAADETAR